MKSDAMQKIFVVTALVVGVLLAVQVRSFRQVEALASRSEPGDVLAELRVFQIANEQLRGHLEEEKKSLAEISGALSSSALEDQIKELRMLGGEESVTGQGLEVTINGPVETYWISDLIAQLVSAGAEAVAVNDIRLTPRTAGFRSVGAGLVMRRDFFNPPLRISMIGSKQALKEAVAQNGGIIDRMHGAYSHITIIVTSRDKIVIPGLERESGAL